MLCLQSLCAAQPALRSDADGLWYSFLDYLRSPAGSDEMAMKELERRLQAIKDRLTSRGAGPYLQASLSSLYPTLDACSVLMSLQLCLRAPYTWLTYEIGQEAGVAPASYKDRITVPGGGPYLQAYPAAPTHGFMQNDGVAMGVHVSLCLQLQ